MAPAFVRLGREAKKRPTMITSARKKPAPESMAKTGLTWALVPLVVRGRVAATRGSLVPMAAMVVDVVEVVATVLGGSVTRGSVTRGTDTTVLVTGGLVVGVTRVVVGTDRTVVGGVVVPRVVVERRWVLIWAKAAGILCEKGPAIPSVNTAMTPRVRATLITLATKRAMTPVCSLPRPGCRTGRGHCQAGTGGRTITSAGNSSEGSAGTGSRARLDSITSCQ